MDKEQLLYLLKTADGPVSGEAISRELGVSRAAIWKEIEALRKDGYVISSATRRGYKLEESPDILRAGAIKSLINTKVIGSEIVCLESIDSTNTECKRRAMSKVTDGLVITADEQTGGRGRLGRTFISPKGKGLYFSCVLKPSAPAEQVMNLTAWVAVAVCEAIEKTCGAKPQIKWTNDIILGGKKLAGILTEMEIEAETAQIRYVIPGIGINCSHAKEDFPEELQNIATSLAIETGRPVDRTALAANLAQELDKLYASFPAALDEYLEKYRKNCCTLGKHVKLISTTGHTEEGEALDIDDQFRLLVKMPDGEIRAVYSGEVSVRGLCGYV